MSFSLFRSSEVSYPKNDCHAQAAYWFAIIQHEKCSQAQLKAFSLWLSENSQHQQAFDNTVMLYEQAGALDTDEDILAIRREALGLGKPKVRSIKRFALAYATAAAALVVAILLAPQLEYFNEHPSATSVHLTEAQHDPNKLSLVTAIGEQITRTLHDGSLIELNTNSEVKIHLTPKQRSIYLLKGQAVFSVAHDKNRPFVVFAGDRRVTALGTMFEVRLGEEDAHVTLLEGKVKVDELSLSDIEPSSAQTAKSIELLPGERYLASTSEMVQVEPQSIQSDLSWRQGRHIFVDEKISKIVSELNRYTERKIVINDPKIGDLRASANFKLGSTQSLSAALEATFNLTVTTDQTSNIITIDWE